MQQHMVDIHASINTPFFLGERFFDNQIFLQHYLTVGITCLKYLNLVWCSWPNNIWVDCFTWKGSDIPESLAHDGKVVELCCGLKLVDCSPRVVFCNPKTHMKPFFSTCKAFSLLHVYSHWLVFQGRKRSCSRCVRAKLRCGASSAARESTPMAWGTEWAVVGGESEVRCSSLRASVLPLQQHEALQTCLNQTGCCLEKRST